jgi:hypothetical protein
MNVQDYKGPRSKTVRPFDQLDIKLAGQVLADELKLGGPIDVFAVARRMFDASGVISSRATPRTAHGPHSSFDQKGQEDGIQQPQAPFGAEGFAPPG